jgi:hypothetical protein
MASLFKREVRAIVSELRPFSNKRMGIPLNDAIRLGDHLWRLYYVTFRNVSHRAKLCQDAGLSKGMRWRLLRTSQLIREHPAWISDGKSSTVSTVLERGRKSRRSQEEEGGSDAEDNDDDDDDEASETEDKDDSETEDDKEKDDNNDSETEDDKEKDDKEKDEEKNDEATSETEDDKETDDTPSQMVLRLKRRLALCEEENVHCKRILRTLQVNRLMVNGEPMRLQRFAECDESGRLLPSRYFLGYSE